MTNTDQVSLDEMARSVVEWMDSWEWYEDSMLGDGFKTKKEVERVDDCRRPPSYLYESLDVIRKVEEALEDELENNYYENLRDNIIPKSDLFQAKYGYDTVTANPETRLRAIYTTLRESGEI